MSVELRYKIGEDSVVIKYEDLDTYTEDIVNRVMSYVMTKEEIKKLDDYKNGRLPKKLAELKFIAVYVMLYFGVKKSHEILHKYNINRFDFYYVTREKFGVLEEKAYEIYCKIKEEILLEKTGFKSDNFVVLEPRTYEKLEEMCNKEYFMAYNNKTKETTKYKLIKL